MARPRPTPSKHHCPAPVSVLRAHSRRKTPAMSGLPMQRCRICKRGTCTDWSGAASWLDEGYGSLWKRWAVEQRY
jgi:hypothetical protein